MSLLDLFDSAAARLEFLVVTRAAVIRYLGGTWGRWACIGHVESVEVLALLRGGGEQGVLEKLGGKGQVIAAAVVALLVRTRTTAKLKMGQKILAHAFSEGLVFRGFNDDILGFAPSLNYTHADVDKLIEILTFSIEKVTGTRWG